MAILNWRDHPRLRFVDFPPPFLTKGSVYIASDRNDSAWISDGTAYYPLYGSGLESPHLGRKTWAELPDPLTVPEGTGATVYGWMAPDAEWLTWNGYWVPSGGRAAVHAPITVDSMAQSGSLSKVLSVPGWQVPANMAANPSLSLEAWAWGVVGNASSVQTRQFSVGIDGATAAHKAILGAVSFTNTNVVARVFGKTNRNSTGNFLNAGFNAQPLTSAAVSNSSIPLSDFVGNPISLWYQGGNPDGSEVLTISSFVLYVGVG